MINNNGDEEFDYYNHIREFYKSNSFFFDKSNIFWLWDKERFRYSILDEIDLMNKLEEFYGWDGWTAKTHIRNKFIEAAKRIGRSKVPKEPLVNWIQCKNKVYDLNTKECFEASPDYFFANPLSWEIGNTEDTPTIDILFNQWVSQEDINDLYEILAWCLLRDYKPHKFIIIYGDGRNGKGQYEKILRRFIDTDNIYSSSIDILATNVFEGVNLYKKLVCFISESNKMRLEATDRLKLLTGDNVVNTQYKHGSNLQFLNYAKIIMTTNFLPSFKDNSHGWISRLKIIKFKNQFKGSTKDIIDTIPEIEYNNLLKKCLRILSTIIEQGDFTSELNLNDDEKKDKYERESNPMLAFVKDKCLEDDYSRCDYSEFKYSFIKYCNIKGLKVLDREEYQDILNRLGIRRKEINGEYYIMGLTLKPEPIKEEKVTNENGG